jgi:uncharacterized protein YndB with AHSA1/START domain
MTKPDITAPVGKQEVLVTSIYNAPRELVYKTVTDPLLVPKWWGPSWMKTTVYKMNVMPGGIWRFLQQDKEGKEYGFHGVYHDVVAPERLVYTTEFEGLPGHVSLHTDQYTEREGITICTALTVFQSLEDRDQMLQWGMEEGTIETTARLNDLLAKINIQPRKEMRMEQHEKNEQCITITRIFDAPRERVWERWTEPGQFMCWWGPKDFTSPYAKFDLRPGGKYLSCMRGPDGKEYWDTGTYEEIIEPHRIVYTNSFADEHGNVVPASYYGMGSDKPMEMEVELTLEDLDGKTRMTLELCGLAAGEMIEQARAGWDQSFDKLAECLG